MTDAGKATVWTAVWQPWGAPHSITGPATLNTRFPGQWFQLEAGLHDNWHRHYDPTLGRYTQPDPLGFVDGPSVYGYARGGPQAYVDRAGRQAVPLPLPGPLIFLSPIIAGCAVLYNWITNPPTNDDDPDQDSLNHCIEAASSKKKWTVFCTSSVWTSPIDKTGTRPARCHSKTHNPPQEKINWCHNEFGQ